MNDGINDIYIKQLNKDDVPAFQQLIQLFREVFELDKQGSVSASYLGNLLSKENFVVFVIMYNSEVAGGLTAFTLPMYHAEKAELFIYDIAVKASLQRNGLGSQLLSALTEYCRRHDVFEMFVAANAADQHAVNFYHATGGEPEQVIHFSYRSDE